MLNMLKAYGLALVIILGANYAVHVYANTYPREVLPPTLADEECICFTIGGTPYCFCL